MEDLLPLEEQFQPEESEQTLRKNHFPQAMGASLALHAICSLILIAFSSGPSSRHQSVTFIDLNLPQQQVAPMTVPAPKPQAEVAPPPEELPVPEKETPAPAAPPQTAEAKPAQAPAAPVEQARQEEERSHTTLGLGLTKGYFKSLGEGESLRPGVKEYYLTMLQQINEKWWLDQGIDKRKIGTIVINLTVARSGQILDSQILRSSGNSRYDRAVVAALTTASPLPPLPHDYPYEVFQAPIRLVPPLNLMSW